MPSASANYKLITPWQWQITPSKYTEPVAFVMVNRIACTFVIAQEHVIILASQKAILYYSRISCLSHRKEEVGTED